MTVEVISWSISTKVWDWAGIKLATPGSAVRLASVARHITDCATRPGPLSTKKNQKKTSNLWPLWKNFPDLRMLMHRFGPFYFACSGVLGPLFYNSHWPRKKNINVGLLIRSGWRHSRHIVSNARYKTQISLLFIDHHDLNIFNHFWKIWFNHKKSHFGIEENNFFCINFLNLVYMRNSLLWKY